MELTAWLVIVLMIAIYLLGIATGVGIMIRRRKKAERKAERKSGKKEARRKEGEK